jgi:ribonuclease HI
MRPLSNDELIQVRRQTLWTFSDAHTVGGKWNCKAGFGAVVLTGEGRPRTERHDAGDCRSSNLAELRAAKMAVEAALEAVNDPSFYHIVVHVDSTIAYGYLQGYYDNYAHLEKEAREIRQACLSFASTQFIQMPRTTVTFRRCETLAKVGLLENYGLKINRSRGISAGSRKNKGRPWNPYKEPNDYIRFIAIEKG